MWEFNIRDSTILGLVGARRSRVAALGAMALFPVGRPLRCRIAIVIMVTAFDAVSRAVRRRLVMSTATIASTPVIGRRPCSVHAGRAGAVARCVVDHCSGERVAIVGHNGAGKSTLLRTVSAFRRIFTKVG